jgi:hypothetical protein
VKETWRGRATIRLRNESTEAVLLTGGGHIASFGLLSGSLPMVNALWESPWPTADPNEAYASTLAARMGTPPVGRFLASFTGHALCLDGFGMPSTLEALQGVSLHGEASIAMWSVSSVDPQCARMSVELPHAQVQVQREFRLSPGPGVLFVDEAVVNLRGRVRNLRWVQHATFGPPFTMPGVARFSASVGKGKTWSDSYEGKDLLEANRIFEWPHVPAFDGKMLDLREPFTHPGLGFVAVALQDAQRSIGFVAAVNRELRLAVGYCFRRSDFPWLTIWEENQVRQEEPWWGQTMVRGMEFGTTPLSSGRDDATGQGDLLGHATARVAAAHERVHAPWIMFVTRVPEGWNEIEDILVEEDALILVDQDRQHQVAAQGSGKFLQIDRCKLTDGRLA